MQMGGHNAFRAVSNWPSVETKDGKWRLAPGIVTALEEAEKYNLTPLILLSGTSEKIKKNFPHGEYLPPWLEYADQTSKLLKGKAPLLQIWNEWDGGHMMSSGVGKINTPENYVELLKQTYPIVKKNCPEAVVMSNSFCTTEEYLYKCFELGMQKYCDAYSIHIYDWKWVDPELSYDSLLRREEMSAKYNNGKPLPFYITEFGWLTNAKAITEELQADYMARFILLARTVKSCKGIFSYNFQDRGENWEQKTNFWGMQVRDLTPKDSFFTVRSAANLVTAAEFVRRIDVGNPDVWILEFRKNDGSVSLAAWTVNPDVRQQIVLFKKDAGSAPVALEKCGYPEVPRTWGFLDRSVDPAYSKPFDPDRFSFHVTTRPVLLHGLPEGFTVEYARAVANPRPKSFVAILPRALAQVSANGGSFSLCGAENWVGLNSKDPYRGNDDLSCHTEVRYDVNKLTLKFTVTDDVITLPGEDQRNWNYDSIQLSFSKVENGKPLEKIYTDYMLSLVKGKPCLVSRTNTRQDYSPKTDAALRIQQAENKMIYELDVPYSEIYTSYEKLQAGNTPVGFTFIINDNDGQGRKGYLSWGRGIGAGWEMAAYGWLYFSPDITRNSQEIGFPGNAGAWKSHYEGKEATLAPVLDGNWSCFKMNIKWEKNGDVTAYCTNKLETPIPDFKEMIVTFKNDTKRQLVVRLVDGTGQTFQYRYAISPSDKIQTVSCRLDNHMFPDNKSLSIWGGAKDKVWHDPLTAVEFVLDSTAWTLDGEFRDSNEATLMLGSIRVFSGK